MLVAHDGAADPRATQTGPVHELPRPDVRRIAEDAARASHPDRLSLPLELEDVAQPARDLPRVAGFENEDRLLDDRALGQIRRPVPEVELVPAERPAPLPRQEHADRLQVVADEGAVASGVHVHGSSDASGDPGERLEPEPASLGAEVEEPLERRAASDHELPLLLLDRRECLLGGQDRALDAAAPHEKIGPAPDDLARNTLLEQRLRDGAERGRIRRLDVEVGRPPEPERRVLRHRLVATHPAGGHSFDLGVCPHVDPHVSSPRARAVVPAAARPVCRCLRPPA